MNKIPFDPKELVAKAFKIIERHPNAVFAYLFGGVARGIISPLSDIDIAVYLDESADLVSEKLALLGDLMEGLETDEIDLVILNTAPLTLKARVLQSRQILLDRKPFLRHAFESLVLREYFDFSLKEQAILGRRFPHGG